MTKEEIINNNIGLVYSMAKHFYNVDFDDLISSGVVGLLKAFENYKDNGTTKFSTYARDYVYGEMYSCVNKNKNIKISREYLKLYKLIIKTKYSLAQKYNRIPSNVELAKFLDKDVFLIEDILLSGETIMSFDNNNYEDKSLYECIKDDSSVNLEEKIVIDDCLEYLTKDEKKIIKARYFMDMTQSEIAKKLNMTQVMVSRYEKKGIEKMRLYMMV